MPLSSVCHPESSRRCGLYDSRKQYQIIIEKLTAAGAQGIILGCTEIGLLVQQADSSLPLFDTTRLHAEAAVELALA